MLTTSRTRSLAGDIAVSGITIETKEWNPSSGLPTSATAAGSFAALPAGTPGYTSPAVSLPNLGLSPAVLLDPMTGEQVQASGVRHPGAASRNIATRITISLNSNGPSSIGVRFGVDFLGGVVLLDGTPIGENWDDPTWYGYWLSDERPDGATEPLWVTNPWGVIELLPLQLSAGPHVIEIIGFESGDDFGTGGQIDVGTGWRDIVAPMPKRTLSVSKLGAAAGSVASAPAGISCGATCTYDFDYGTVVTLTASATPSSVFAGWGGACTGMSSTCVVTMNMARTVTAKFVGAVTTTGMTMETRFWDRAGTQPNAGNAWTLFESLPTDSPGYTNEPVPVPVISNNGSLFTAPNIGAGVNLGTRTVLGVTAASAAEMRIRANVDFQAGGGIWVDGTLITSVFGGVAPGDNLTLDAMVALPAGAHSITMIGFEDCCDGGARLQIDFGTGLADVAAPMPPPQPLTVSTTSGGAVTSQPAGISCGSLCTASFTAGSQVTLTAVASAGYAFSGWSGGYCSGANPVCVVRMNQARAVSATFVRLTQPLTVTKSGTGTGTVTSAPAGITCGTTCTASFDEGINVTLTATASTGSVFTGWSGACTGSGACVVPMSAAKSVNAEFTRLFALTVTKSGTGTGTVTSAPAGITCGADCSESYAEGTSVTLTAAATTGSAFAGWTGACTGTGTGTGACTVPMSAARSVNAEFTRLTATMTVTVMGTTGSGVVTSSPAGINCAMTTCTATFPQGTVVTLTAAPNPGSSFAGWGGACSGTGTCTVTMAAAVAVTAQFTKQTDTTPPTISCSADPDRLWPVNRKMRDIRVRVTLTDAGSGANGFKLLSVTSNEPANGQGDGNTSSDIAGWTLNTADVTGELRAERAGTLRDRIYTITYRGFDKAGNSATASCAVVVPHDQRSGDDDDDDDGDDDGNDKDDKDKDKKDKNGKKP